MAPPPSLSKLRKGKEKEKEKSKPPPIDKLIKPAIGVALALVAYQFIRGLKGEIRRINVDDELEIRDVFFGEGGTGNSYAVLCQEESSTKPISSVFQDAYRKGKSPAQFRLLDCNHILPSSGKSIAERFNLDLNIRPTVFVSGAVGEPRQVPEKHLKTGEMLDKVLRSKLEGRTAKIETTQDLRTKCLDKELCGLLLKGAAKAPSHLKDAVNKLIKEYPSVAFAAVDTSVLYVKNLEEYLPELEGTQARFVVFQKISGSLAPGGSRLVTSIAVLPTNGASYSSMSSLIDGVLAKTATVERIPQLPIIKTRTKKLVQEEKAKRDRRADQQRRQNDKTDGSSTSSSGSQENDGSRDGRRAERDRRRSEHREKNNVREKTPEEMAEMERKRRERMEEEAARWNVAPEDAGEEGAAFYEDEEEGLDEEDLDEEQKDHKDHSGPGEDVIDLD